MAWLAHSFGSVLFVALEAGSARQPVDTMPAKRTLPSEDGGSSKRLRTGMDTFEAIPPLSTLDILHRLRRRQLLSVSEEFRPEIRVGLGAGRSILTERNMEPTLTKNSAEIVMKQEIPGSRVTQSMARVPSTAWFPPVFLDADKDTTSRPQTQIGETSDNKMTLKSNKDDSAAVFLQPISTAKLKTTSPISAAPSCEATTSRGSLVVPTIPRDCQASLVPTQSPTISTIPQLQPSHTPVPFNSSAIIAANGPDETAVLFVEETTEMAKHGAPPISTPSCVATTNSGSLVVPATSRNCQASLIPAQSPTMSTMPQLQSSHTSVTLNSSAIVSANDPDVLGEAAVLFIEETIEMVKRGKLLSIHTLHMIPAHDERTPNASAVGRRPPNQPKYIENRKHPNKRTEATNKENSVAAHIKGSKGRKAKTKAKLPLLGGARIPNRPSNLPQKAGARTRAKLPLTGEARLSNRPSNLPQKSVGVASLGSGHLVIFS
ncbi:hypothetical protein C8R44DRAFT_873988 [Mycena epipterygia]|nr:hypothetical protein C8R44DRAFT_873988 [Mycena epipterygia]